MIGENEIYIPSTIKCTIEWLIQNGKITEEQSKIILKNTLDDIGGYWFIEFQGINSCWDLVDEYDKDACSGWDMESRRCECENRRVAWELSYEKDRLYAEAY